MGLLVATTTLLLAGTPAHGFLGNFTVGLRASDSSALASQLESLGDRVDGVGLERRVSDVGAGGTRQHEDELLLALRTASEGQRRSFHVAWDVRGAEAERWAALVRWDWANVIDGQLRLTASGSYLREQGRPVVVLRGLGAVDAPGTVAETMDLIDWLKDRGCYVVARVPAGWRQGATRPHFLSAFARVDAVQVEPTSGPRSEEVLRDDSALAVQLGLGLQLAFDAATLAEVSEPRELESGARSAGLPVSSAPLQPAEPTAPPAVFEPALAREP
ncbi:MAG: hypothetical protein JNJ54_02340 [Myxococcaceae bacterium]|nr:hypothetical protein [Myxococcaceae bacterium]